jgi:predicted TIM-barrel fold metal-dependent hydrolase
VVVDHQTHWYPRAAWERLLERPDYPRARCRDGAWFYQAAPDDEVALGPPWMELQAHFDDMDAHGVDAMVCTAAGLPGIGDVSMLELSEATEMARLVNHEMADAQREHPDRIIGLCVLPMQDPDCALEVLEQAISGLGLKGVSMHSNINGEAIVDVRTEPVYARIAELGVPIVLHPTLHTAMSGTYARFGTMFEATTWMFDTSAAALSLIVGGLLDRHPELRVIHPHAGGALPFIAGRIAGLDRTMGNRVARPTAAYLAEFFYTDTVNTTPGALALAAATYGWERILFATDFPWLPRRPVLDHLKRDLPAEELERVLGANAVPGLEPPARSIP